MPDPVITNVDTGSVELEDGKFGDELLTFGGAGTVVAGTILARDSVSLKLIPYVKGGVTNEDGIAKAVLTYDVIAAGAGDEAIRALVHGVVNRDRLIIDADGDGSNIDAVELDGLRDFNITTQDVEQLAQLDNQ